MFSDFFSMDGPFFKYGTLVFDLLVLTLIFCVVSGPLAFALLFAYAGGVILSVTGSAAGIIFNILLVIAIIHIGPALTALFYVTNRKNRGDDGYLFKDYFKSYKMNYKQGLLVSVILFFIAYVLCVNISAITGINIISFLTAIVGLGEYVATPPLDFGFFGNILLPVQMFIAMEFIFIIVFIYPMLARFHMGTRELFKTAFILANKHLFTTIASIAILIALGALVIMVHPLFILFFISGYAMLSSYLFERVFKKYMPSEDKDLEQELEEMNSQDEDYDAMQQQSLAELFKQKREEQDKD